MVWRASTRPPPFILLPNPRVHSTLTPTLPYQDSTLPHTRLAVGEPLLDADEAMQGLQQRLSEAERAFVRGRFAESLGAANSVITDLIAITRPPAGDAASGSVTGRSPRARDGKSSKVSRPTLHHDSHICAEGCCCEAAVALCMQCLYELVSLSNTQHRPPCSQLFLSSPFPPLSSLTPRAESHWPPAPTLLPSTTKPPPMKPLPRT